MQNFTEWKIKNSLCTNAEIYFVENTLIGGIRHENGLGYEQTTLPGQKIYKVTDNDEQDNTVVLTDQEGNRYKFDQDELSKALAENSTMRGFQILQYPISYVFAGSGTELSKLSIYDSRLKVGQKLKEKDVSKMFTKSGKFTNKSGKANKNKKK